MVGHDGAQRGVLPTHKRFEPDDPIRLKLDNGLVDQRELIIVDDACHVGFELQALDGRRPHRRLVQHPARLAPGLGLIHRNVGVAQQ